MGTLTVSKTNDYLLRDGRPWLYLADTAWSAFTNPTREEWTYYLDFRRRQGFTALQINTMPQPDRSDNSWDAPLPFARDQDGSYRWDKPQAEYYQRAGELAMMAAQCGFVPALVLLWASMIHGTWQTKTFKTKPLPLELVQAHVDRLIDAFAASNPIWIISGDTDLPEEAKPAYKAALDLVRERTPHLLCMLHIGAGQDQPRDWVDIYSSYSGHSVESGRHAAQQAADRLQWEPHRPVLNLEPCYEAMGHGGHYGRFTAFDVRWAIWAGLLSGAKAGSAYGAHGVWSWHRSGVPFCAREHWDEPLDWREALHLSGAVDMGLVRQIWEDHRLWQLNPRQDLLIDMPPEVRLAASKDLTRFATYIPYPRTLCLNLDLSGYELLLVNLAARQFL